ncbi:MAG: xylulokinase [Acidimicrobiales bacterium]
MQRGSQSSGNKEAVLTAGIDIGTTAVKGVIADEQGRVVHRWAVPNRLQVQPGGRLEHDAAMNWWQMPRQVLATLASRLPLGSISAVAVAAFMPSVAAVGPTGRPLGPGLIYGDERGRQALDDAEGENQRKATGSEGLGASPGRLRATSHGDPTSTDEMARLAGWVAARKPGAAGYWPAQAVANASLGGEGVVDLATAFAAGSLFSGSGWDEAACREAGLKVEQLPRVAVFGEPIGKVALAGLVAKGHDPRLLAGGQDGDAGGAVSFDEAVASAGFGAGAALGAQGEAVLGAGSVDGLCEQLVAGAVDDGDVLVSLGSTLVVWLTVPGWPDAAPGLWRVPHVVAGKAMLGGASNAGGLWVDWVNKLLRDAPAGGDDLVASEVPVWWPWVRGERVPWHDPDLRVSLSGGRLSQGAGALRRGAFEATGFVVRHILELASACGTQPTRVLVSGGGVRNPAWLQAIADVLGLAVVPAVASEGAARGAAFLARMALGLETSTDSAARWASWSAPVVPRSEWVAAAGRRYERWLAGLPRR